MGAGAGRWQDAKNPKAYIKTVAKREALKMLVDNPSDQSMTLRIPIDLRDKGGRPLSHDAHLGGDLNHPSTSRQARSRLAQSGGTGAFHWMRILAPRED